MHGAKVYGAVCTEHLAGYLVYCVLNTVLGAVCTATKQTVARRLAPGLRRTAYSVTMYALHSTKYSGV